MARDIAAESDYYTSHGGIIPVKWTAPEVPIMSLPIFHAMAATIYVEIFARILFNEVVKI